jgi:hypothetical protein
VDRLLAELVDAAFCALLLAGALLLAVLIAGGRGAPGAAAVTSALGLAHLGIATVVVAVYRLAATWLRSRTLGRRAADRLAASPYRAAPPVRAGRPVMPMLVPTLLIAGFAGALTGATVPTAGVTATAAWSGPAARDYPRDLADAQARTLDGLLDASAGSRTSLRAALADAEACRSGAAAAATLRRVADERDLQLRRARDLPVDALPNGPDARTALVEALLHSVSADRAFALWAERVGTGYCGHDANHVDATAASRAATAAKRRFCLLWNPIATGAGLRTRVEEEV